MAGGTLGSLGGIVTPTGGLIEDADTIMVVDLEGLRHATDKLVKGFGEVMKVLDADLEDTT
jgi:hypothetical protein